MRLLAALGETGSLRHSDRWCHSDRYCHSDKGGIPMTLLATLGVTGYLSRRRMFYSTSERGKDEKLKLYRPAHKTLPSGSIFKYASF